MAPTVDLTDDRATTVAVTPLVEHAAPTEDRPVVFDVTDLGVYYGDFRAVRDVNLAIHQHEVTAFIGTVGLRQDAPCCAASTA